MADQRKSTKEQAIRIQTRRAVNGKRGLAATVKRWLKREGRTTL